MAAPLRIFAVLAVALVPALASAQGKPIVGYDPITRQSVQLRPGGTLPPTTDLRVRPYLETGFKAYMSQRAYFRGDLRVLVRGGFDEAVLRCGFGIDF